LFGLNYIYHKIITFKILASKFYQGNRFKPIRIHRRLS